MGKQILQVEEERRELLRSQEQMNYRRRVFSSSPINLQKIHPGASLSFYSSDGPLFLVIEPIYQSFYI